MSRASVGSIHRRTAGPIAKCRPRCCWLRLAAVADPVDVNLRTTLTEIPISAIMPLPSHAGFPVTISGDGVPGRRSYAGFGGSQGSSANRAGAACRRMARTRGFHGRSTTGPTLRCLSRDPARGDRGTWSRLRRRGQRHGLVAWKQVADEQPIKLPDAEQMIDELDRIMTAYGTISVKTPDVWGQDRLAKFRSEYESQMGAWLKVGFKNDINASIRRSESDATRVQVGTEIVQPAAQRVDARPAAKPARSVSTRYRRRMRAWTRVCRRATVADKSQPTLESTVVLDEHSNYLNHLNQLRRVNAGDDLADRPGYGLYLVRIPVTLRPDREVARGKGAIITVSAKSVMTKHTLRGALQECRGQ